MAKKIKMAKSPKTKPLTGKEFAFVTEYLKDWNGARAYRVCYPKGKPEHSRNRAREILAKQHVKQAVDDYKAELKAKSKITIERLAKPLEQIAEAKLLDYIDPKTNKLLNLADTPNPHAIKKLKTTETTTGTGKNKVTKVVAELELHDPKAANESLRKLYGMDEQQEETETKLEITIKHVAKGNVIIKTKGNTK